MDLLAYTIIFCRTMLNSIIDLNMPSVAHCIEFTVRTFAERGVLLFHFTFITKPLNINDSPRDIESGGAFFSSSFFSSSSSSSSSSFSYSLFLFSFLVLPYKRYLFSYCFFPHCPILFYTSLVLPSSIQRCMYIYSSLKLLNGTIVLPQNGNGKIIRVTV